MRFLFFLLFLGHFLITHSNHTAKKEKSSPEKRHQEQPTKIQSPETTSPTPKPEKLVSPPEHPHEEKNKETTTDKGAEAQEPASGQAASSQTPPSPEKPQELTITNNITNDMITYHYLGSHTPSKFRVEVNGKELGATPTTLHLKEPILEVIYSYQFDVGGIAYKKGSKKVTFKIDPHIKSTVTTFNWQSKERVLIEHAECMSTQDI